MHFPELLCSMPKLALASVGALFGASVWPAAAGAQSPAPTQIFEDTGAGNGFARPPNIQGVVIEGETINLGTCSTAANIFNIMQATNDYIAFGTPTYTEITIKAQCDPNISDWASAVGDVIDGVAAFSNADACYDWGGVLLDEEFPGYGFSQSTIDELNTLVDERIALDGFTCTQGTPSLAGEAFWSANSGYTDATYADYKMPNGSTFVYMTPQAYTPFMAGLINSKPEATMTWQDYPDLGYGITGFPAANAAVTNSPICLSFHNAPCEETWSDWWVRA